MEIAIRKATRLDYNPPKKKHLDTMVSLTFHNPAIITEMLNLLERRHRENSWIVSFKVLTIFHLLMRKGNGDRTMEYISKNPSALDITRLREKSSGIVHIQNLYLYTSYLEQKVAAFRELDSDCVRTTMANTIGRLRHLSVANGLLRETQVLQKQMSALLKCKFILDDVDNTISLYAFQLLIKDLLVLFQAVNEGVVNILEHYFAMVKADARISLGIYKRFAKQTENTIEFLAKARQLQHEMPDIHIPTIKHAPLSLATALEEYLHDLSDKHIYDHTTPGLALSSPAASNPDVAPKKPIEYPNLFASLGDEHDGAVSSLSTPTPIIANQHNPFRSSMNPFRASVYPTQATATQSTPSLIQSSLPLSAVSTPSLNPFLQHPQPPPQQHLSSSNGNPFAPSSRNMWDTSIF